MAGVDPEALRRTSACCPFSDDAPNEDTIAARLFPSASGIDPCVGRYEGLLAGRISDQQEILRSSSGGLTTWLLIELLQRGLIDGVVHLGSTAGKAQDIFEFGVSHTVQDVRSRRKSQYFSADFSSALASIKGNGKRYAFVGVPCYAKAIRQIALVDEVIRDQIAFVIALVCGHMKSPAFAELLSWQLGIEPTQIATVDFRVKEGSSRADDYNFSVTSKSGAVQTGRTRNLYGTNWGHATFQLKSCDFCDDVFGETADVCLGDAWLDRYSGDPRGTNIVVVRRGDVAAILEDGRRTGAISLESVSLQDAVQSQAGNFRHRRDGMAIRIHDAEAAGQWHPRKRAFARYADVSLYRRAIVRMRQKLGAATHPAFLAAKRAGRLSVFFDITGPLVRRMELLYKLPLLTSPTQVLKRGLMKVARKLGYAD
jgi:coenzyme F420-reducing hydrogenase beta subunit